MNKLLVSGAVLAVSLFAANAYAKDYTVKELKDRKSVV